MFSINGKKLIKSANVPCNQELWLISKQHILIQFSKKRLNLIETLFILKRTWTLIRNFHPQGGRSIMPWTLNRSFTAAFSKKASFAESNVVKRITELKEVIIFDEKMSLRSLSLYQLVNA